MSATLVSSLSDFSNTGYLVSCDGAQHEELPILCSPIKVTGIAFFASILPLLTIPAKIRVLLCSMVLEGVSMLK